MVLTKAQVFNFRSIEDSGSVEIDHRITALVGQNESGKTAFLHALHKARSTEGGIGFDVTEDYPRKDLLDYEEVHEERPAVVVRLWYELEAQEVEAVNAWLGHDLFETLGFWVDHKYDNAHSISLSVPEPQHVAWLTSSVALSSDAKAAVQGATTLDEFFELVRAADLTPSDEETISELEAKYPEVSGGWRRLNSALWKKHLSPRLPVFLYFDDYRTLPGRTYLAGLQQRKVGGDMKDEDRGILRLLGTAGLTPKKLIEPGGYEREKARLEATGNKISRKVFGFWRQNPELKVQFDVAEDREAEHPFNQGKNLHIRIENRRHEVTVPFDQRSKGFIWFFSFIAWFDSIRAEIEDDRRLILLLDEPGLSLHALAQRDFLSYIESLSGDHQILYSTHSPFMVESARLDRVRTVEDKREKGTVISGEVVGSDPDTLFPLQAALGYSIAQNLFVSDKNLLVEGIADLAILQAADELVRAAGRTGLREDVTITPVGGIGKVSAFASLFGANDLVLTVLHDYDGQEDQQIAHLVREKVLPRRGVLHYAEFRENGGTSKPSDVEDMINPGTYLRYFNKAYEGRLSGKVKVSDLPPGDRMVDRINRYLTSSGTRLRQSDGFNHYLPAKAFAASPPKSLSDAELDRFERLFVAANRSFD